MILSGVLVNGLGVVAGGLAGLLLKQGISEKVKTLLMQSLALGVLYVGLSEVGGGHNTVYIIVSLTIGAIIGETINFDQYFHAFGEWIQKKSRSRGKHPWRRDLSAVPFLSVRGRWQSSARWSVG